MIYQRAENYSLYAVHVISCNDYTVNDSRLLIHIYIHIYMSIYIYMYIYIGRNSTIKISHNYYFEYYLSPIKTDPLYFFLLTGSLYTLWLRNARYKGTRVTFDLKERKKKKKKNKKKFIYLRYAPRQECNRHSLCNCNVNVNTSQNSRNMSLLNVHIRRLKEMYKAM